MTALHDNIPEELHSRTQWVCYRRVSSKNRKLQNVPFVASGQRHASCTAPTDWSTFEEASAAITQPSRKLDGISYVLTADDGLVCVDLDHARDPETGSPEPWAQEIIDKIGSYTEVSPSGTGYHIFVRGTVPAALKTDRVEIYASSKIMATTGDVEFPHTVIVDAGLDWLYERAKPTTVNNGSGDSEKVYAIWGELRRELKTDDSASLAREFERRYPDIYRAQNAKHGNNYMRADAERYIEKHPLTPVRKECESKIAGESFDSVKEKPLLWLWKNRIPRHKVTIFGGNPDAGKSLVSLDLSARLTTGRDFPDGEKNQLGPVDVALLFCEDDPADTVKPRLLAAGADCAKVYRLFSSVVAKDGSTKERHIAFDTDLQQLERFLLERRAIRFLVIDPISSYLGEASMVKETDVRRVLVPLAELAARLEVTVLLIAHLNKRSDVSALHKIMGAVAISGVARAAWMFAEDHENEDTYLMVRGKLNVGRKSEGLRYSIAAKTIPECGEAPFIKWEGTTSVSAGEVFGLLGPMEESKADKTVEAMTWLQGFLAAGAKPASEVSAAAKRVGIAERTLDRAKGKMKIKSAKRAEGWVWELPAGDEERQLEVAIV